jgi:hypothetical protein
MEYNLFIDTADPDFPFPIYPGKEKQGKREIE